MWEQFPLSTGITRKREVPQWVAGGCARRPPLRSDVGLLSNGQGAVDLDAQVAHRVLQLGVPE